MESEVTSSLDTCDMPSIRQPPSSIGVLSIERPPDGSNPRGYSIMSIDIVVGGVNDKFLCVKCGLLLKEPVQHPCGHRFCRYCLAWSPPDARCPGCQSEGELYTLQSSLYIPDAATKREILQLKAKCMNSNCPWTGIFKFYISHAETCGFRTVTCECGENVCVAEFSTHKTSFCKARQIACRYCSINIAAANIRNHTESECREVDIPCTLGCGNVLKRKDVETHVDPVKGTCKNKPCVFGCPESGEGHYVDSSPQHCLTLLSQVTSVSNSAREIESRLSTLEAKLPKLKTKLDAHDSTPSQEPLNAAGQASTARADGNVAFAAAVSTMPGTSAKATICSIKELQGKQNVLEDVTAVIDRQVERLITDQSGIAQIISQNNESLDQLRRQITSVERSLALKDLALAEQELRLKEIETTSFDGKLIWPIKDFSKRRQDAITGRTPSIYSTPFYTSRAGYKMCVRIYLNGDGMGRGTHISLFFVIMKSQFDPILPWPFRQKVVLTLMDQNNREHVIDAFRPDPSSSSFRRPQSAMNIASGVPLFCPLSKLEDRRYSYVKDDTMYIKVHVDTAGIQ